MFVCERSEDTVCRVWKRRHGDYHCLKLLYGRAIENKWGALPPNLSRHDTIVPKGLELPMWTNPLWEGHHSNLR